MPQNTSSNVQHQASNSRPQFYIDNPAVDQQVQRASFTLEPPGSKHKFTVTTNNSETMRRLSGEADQQHHQVQQVRGTTNHLGVMSL
jgi:hypothetical protein